MLDTLEQRKADAFHFTALPPLALYVHIPWCLRKCPYCDFNSHPAGKKTPHADYLAALIEDLEQELPKIWGRTVESIFIGGGTPSLLSAAEVDRLLSDLRARLPLAPHAEITLEANPGTFEQEKFTAYRDAGINRLSIGIQSFNDLLLKKIGRIHSGTEARRAITMARQAGFDNINIDLMFGLPGQTIAQALNDLETALSFVPEHLSHYQLTIEPNTLFAHQPPRLPNDEMTWQMQLACQRHLAVAGYENYEVSAYARPSMHSRHNLNYWQFGDYLGIGSGAHSKLTDAHQQQIRRHWKIKHPREYIAHAAGNKRVGGEVTLDSGAAALEFMMNALRMPQGFASHLFRQRSGLPLTVIHDQLADAEQRGLIDYSADWIQPTVLGIQHLNTLLGYFMPEES